MNKTDTAMLQFLHLQYPLCARYCTSISKPGSHMHRVSFLTQSCFQMTFYLCWMHKNYEYQYQDTQNPCFFLSHARTGSKVKPRLFTSSPQGTLSYSLCERKSNVRLLAFTCLCVLAVVENYILHLQMCVHVPVSTLLVAVYLTRLWVSTL